MYGGVSSLFTIVSVVFTGPTCFASPCRVAAGASDVASKQARELGITQPLLGTDGWDDFKVADIAGVDALNNTFFSTHYSDKDESVKPFIEAFTKEYNHAPNVFAALGYDAGRLIVDAIKRAGSDDSVKIKDAIASTKDLQVGTGIITMDKNHNPIKQAVILENKNGDRVMVAKIMPEAE